MSGGAFDYLCWKENWGLDVENVEAFVGALTELAPDHRATRAVILLLVAMEFINKHENVFSDLALAVEWWKSGDRTKESALKALSRWTDSCEAKPHL